MLPPPLRPARCALRTVARGMSSVSTAPRPLGLFSYGDGFLGSLGTGSYADVSEPTRLPATLELDVKQLSAGWAHGGFVTAEGEAFIFGRTHSFRDVIRSTNMHRLSPGLVGLLNRFTQARGVDTLTPALLELPEGERVAKMVCSAALTLLLTESGRLFALGANGYGQCGVGKESVSVEQPALVSLGDERVVDVAAGFQHALAVTESGTVWSWGKGERGQLGYGVANVSAPQEILALKGANIAHVSAGFNFSSALSAAGELFLWGKLLNLKGKEENDGDQLTPRLVRTSAAVTRLQCSHFHTAFVTADDKVWAVGRTPSGRQAHKDFAHVSSATHATPFLIAGGSELRARDVVRIGKGVNSSVFVTRDGQVFEWSFTTGVERLDKAAGMRVAAAESGFRYHLLLAEVEQ